MGDLKGKAAVVTGGARGIGRAIVLELAMRGSDVAVSDVNISGAENCAREAEKLGVRAIAIKVDVTKRDDVATLMEEAIRAFGKIDILVNNAGITRDILLIRMNEEEWDSVLDVNLKGAFLCTQKVLRGMMKQRSGKIITITSVVGVMGNAGQSNYAASKAGLIGFTRSVAKEAASRNIQVNAVAPGYIETDMTADLPEEVKSNYLMNIPAKRPGKPEDVARVVGFLASSDADYITGQVLYVDGGLLMA